MFDQVPDNTMTAMFAAVGFLLFATIVLAVLRRLRPQQNFSELGSRIRSWWIMGAMFVVALVATPKLSIGFMAFMSFLALKELLSIMPVRRADRALLMLAYLAIPIQYGWVASGWYGVFIIFIPVYMFLLLPAAMVLVGETRGFIKAAGTLHWCLMLTVFGLSHMAYLLALPPEGNPAGGGPGLVFFLVYLTQFNDVAQFLSGKTFGRHKVIPRVSPNKTWEGLIGGVAATTALATLSGPFLTPLTQLESLIAGLLIGVAGFLGDVTVSAVKRDLGIKDTGALIPGHGGIMDRIDSLTFTAPLFFHYLYYLHY